jgi:FKBP-type peptidyl-prolyl cis-trans isomerase
MKSLVYTILVLLFVSCEVEGVKKDANTNLTNKKSIKKELTAFNSDNLEVSSTKNLENGLKISWIEKGEGENIKKGDVVIIDYKVTLKNGTVVDGNHLLNKASFPFMVGFEMQTKGWDLALEQLRVGDFARILIPANLARGEKGIKGLIPPNSDNFLSIRILSKLNPTRTIDGVKVWLFEENKANKLTFNDNNSVTFHSIISSESHPMYYNSFRTNAPYNLRMTDKGIVPGLKKALKKSKKADRMYILVPSSQAYGEQGLEEFVGSNEDIFYNVVVMDVTKN